MPIAQWNRTRAAITAVALVAVASCGGLDTVAPSPQQTVAGPGGVRQVVTTPAAVNLIQNASLETMGAGGLPANWLPMTYGWPAPTFSYPVAGRSGNGALVSFATLSLGDARRQHASVAVTPKQLYTFSVWYKSSTVSSINIEYEKKDGKKSYGWIADLPSSNGA